MVLRDHHGALTTLYRRAAMIVLPADRPHGQSTIEQGSMTASVGESVTVTCLPPADRGNPHSSWFTWRKEGDTLWTRNSSGPLTIITTGEGDTGWYRCSAANWLGEGDPSEMIHIAVKCKLTLRATSGTNRSSIAEDSVKSVW